MTRELKWASIAFIVILIVWGLNSTIQNRHVTKTNDVFAIEKDDVFEVEITKGLDAITLIRQGDSWFIMDHDSLVMKQGRIDNLMDKALFVRRETLVSTNPEKWSTYSVDDSLGTIIYWKDASGGLLGSAAFGRSKSDWSHNYVRLLDEEDVYLTNENIIFALNTSADYWGEVPKPPEPDTSAVLIQ